MKHFTNIALLWWLLLFINLIHAKLSPQQIKEILQRINDKADLIKSQKGNIKNAEPTITKPATVYTPTIKVTKTYAKATRPISHKQPVKSTHTEDPPQAVVTRPPFIPDYLLWNNFSSSFINNTINSVESLKAKNISIYYALFAGRAELIKIHFQYTDILLKLGLVTEVHIWDFTNGNEADADYLSNFKMQSELPGYKLFLKPSTNYYRGDFTKPGQNVSYKYLWYSFYEHYLINKRYQPQDIFIKADDDIVFVDISSFQLFINEIINCTGSNLHFPNIINNDAGFIVQAARIHNAAPEMQKWWEYFTVNPFQMDFQSRFNDYYDINKLLASSVYATPLTTWDHGTFILPAFAYDAHMCFLRDPGKYLNELHSSELSKLVPLNQRISINMYAGSFLVMQERFRSFLFDHCCDDEGFVGSIPTFFNVSHIIHTDFVIAHFAFHPQYKDGNLLPLRAKYSELADMFTAEYEKRQQYNITSRR